MIGRHMNLSEKDMVTLETAALLHDFGKIGVDEDLLLKPSKLTKKQKTEIENHVIRGYYILLGFEELEKSLEGVRNHHEHYNGTGYPRGATSTNISLFGRIIAVADAYDAMTSERPYRRAKTKKEAIAELQRCAGTEFDPEIVEAFVQVITKRSS
jgi:HD-GYP domain-containing protein (c-di-GMP phosphodiesterase class II)